MPTIEDLFPTRYVDEKTVLPNGVTVITRAVDPTYYHPRNALIGVDVLAGGRHAPPGQAHFLEHIIAAPHFTSWQEFSHKFAYELSSNAITHPHRMSFGPGSDDGTEVLVDDLYAALRVNLAMIKYPDFGQENIERERRRIIEEISGQDLEGMRNWEFATAHTGVKMFNRSLGLPQDVESISASDLMNAYEQLFVGSNLVILAAYPGNKGVTHHDIVALVDKELAHIPVGLPASDLKSPAMGQVDLRFDNMHLSDRQVAHVVLAVPASLLYHPRYTAEVAVAELYANRVSTAVREAGLGYYFWAGLDPFDFQSKLTTDFKSSKENARLILNLAAENLSHLGTGDIESDVERYKRQKARAYLQTTPNVNTAYMTLKFGNLFTGMPKHPDQFFLDTAQLTTADIGEAVRVMIHGPLALRADIGKDGDPEGKYVPFVAEFAEQLRAGVPLPKAEAAGGKLDFLPPGVGSKARKLDL